MNGKKFLASFLSAAMICSQFSALAPKASAKPLGPGAKGAIAGVGGFASGAVIFGVPLLLKVLAGKSDEQPTMRRPGLREWCKWASGEAEYPGLDVGLVLGLLNNNSPGSCVAVCYSGKDGLKHLIEDFLAFNKNPSLEVLSDSAEIVSKTNDGKYICNSKSDYQDGPIDPNNVAWFFENGGVYCKGVSLNTDPCLKSKNPTYAISCINGAIQFVIIVSTSEESWSYREGSSGQPLEWNENNRGFFLKNS